MATTKGRRNTGRKALLTGYDLLTNKDTILKQARTNIAKAKAWEKHYKKLLVHTNALLTNAQSILESKYALEDKLYETSKAHCEGAKKLNGANKNAYDQRVKNHKLAKEIHRQNEMKDKIKQGKKQEVVLTTELHQLQKKMKTNDDRDNTTKQHLAAIKSERDDLKRKAGKLQDRIVRETKAEARLEEVKNMLSYQQGQKEEARLTRLDSKSNRITGAKMLQQSLMQDGSNGMFLGPHQLCRQFEQSDRHDGYWFDRHDGGQCYDGDRHDGGRFDRNDVGRFD